MNKFISLNTADGGKVCINLNNVCYFYHDQRNGEWNIVFNDNPQPSGSVSITEQEFRKLQPQLSL